MICEIEFQKRLAILLYDYYNDQLEKDRIYTLSFKFKFNTSKITYDDLEILKPQENHE